MKANKKTLMAVKNFLNSEYGFDMDEVMRETIFETKMIHSKDIKYLIDIEDCVIQCGDIELCAFDSFIDMYTKGFVEKLCNILDSFIGADLQDYDCE